MSTDIQAEIAAAISSVTNGWDEPLDEVHDIPPITKALLAQFDITPRTTTKEN